MNITPKDLLDAGVHIGHQLRRWNPKSREFVYKHEGNVSIIDLEKTYNALEAATKFVEETVASGKDILLVATKRQAQELVRDAATQTGMPYAVNRWLGGCLTNFETLKTSLEKYNKYLKLEAEEFRGMPKKEVAVIKRQMKRMNRGFEGLRTFNKLPGALFIVDIKNEEIAVNEANRLHIPTVGLVDTNSDPTKVTYAIPGNDDAVKSVRLIVSVIKDAIEAGIARRPAAKQFVAPKKEVATVDPAEAVKELNATEDAPAKTINKPVRRRSKKAAPKAE
ncbi:MAG: 30S ribosomal protein S2 [Opitutales bacterium]|nr:30S ribosomal protein S2 [Opitutales bacterium]